MAREDLNPVEEARACAALVEELGLTREEVGLRVGRSRVAVSNLIRLLDLPDEALELLERGELSEGHGRALLLADRPRRPPPPRARRRSTAGWSVRELEDRARARRRPPAGSASAPRARTRRLHPDQAGRDRADRRRPRRRARPRGRGGARQGRGYRVQLSFESLDEALELARRLRVRARLAPGRRSRPSAPAHPQPRAPLESAVSRAISSVG